VNIVKEYFNDAFFISRFVSEKYVDIVVEYCVLLFLAENIVAPCLVAIGDLEESLNEFQLCCIVLLKEGIFLTEMVVLILKNVNNLAYLIAYSTSIK
jgi:hypothetical protein